MSAAVHQMKRTAMLNRGSLAGLDNWVPAARSARSASVHVTRRHPDLEGVTTVLDGLLSAWTTGTRLAGLDVDGAHALIVAAMQTAAPRDLREMLCIERVCVKS